MEISYNIYQQQGETLLAACDKELLGKTLKEGEVHLEVKESFYGGEETDIDGLCEYFDSSTIANLVGKKTVERAIEEGFGYEENILWIEDIPHLQIVRL